MGHGPAQLVKMKFAIQTLPSSFSVDLNSVPSCAVSVKSGTTPSDGRPGRESQAAENNHR